MSELSTKTGNRNLFKNSRKLKAGRYGPSLFRGHAKKSLHLRRSEGTVGYVYVDAGWLDVSGLGRVHVVFSRKNREPKILGLEPIPITQSIPAGCKARCLRCRPKTFSAWNKPRLRAFLACRLGLGLFAQPHDDQVIRIGS